MLEEQLRQLAAGDVYPWHMPGHKRQFFADFPNPCQIDITEIEGFDNLHHSRGILKAEQERAASVYGSRRCFYLVNGSTCGLLAAICAITRPGDRILVARNCHKAVYNAIYLWQLSPVYVYPAVTRCGPPGQIRAEDVRQMLAKNPDIRAVVITSPTYEGIVSDVAAIASLSHDKGIPLIVDEAHGAHLGFHPAFPENAVRLGADAVIMSVHKTLPAFTQTALLHLCGDRIRESDVARFLEIFETSSPSYVLMAGISRCVEMLAAADIKERFDSYVKRLDTFRESVWGLSNLRVPGTEAFRLEEAYAFDPGKLMIKIKNYAMSGGRFQKLLLERYHLQTEMAGIDYVLAMTSLADSAQGFRRLSEALLELDAEFDGMADTMPQRSDMAEIYAEKERCMDPREAADAPHEVLGVSEAADRICADFVCFYPPGIPVFVPGERLDKQTLERLAEGRASGLDVEGFVDEAAIRVVKKEKV